jgi:hypothetical protein
MSRPSSMNTNDTSCVVATIVEYKYHVSLVFERQSAAARFLNHIVTSVSILSHHLCITIHAYRDLKATANGRRFATGMTKIEH